MNQEEQNRIENWASKNWVRCNCCQHIFPRQKGIFYRDRLKRVPCPICSKGVLDYMSLKVNQKQLEKDRYNREHPSFREKCFNSCMKKEPSTYGRKMTFYQRLNYARELISATNNHEMIFRFDLLFSKNKNLYFS